MVGNFSDIVVGSGAVLGFHLSGKARLVKLYSYSGFQFCVDWDCFHRHCLNAFAYAGAFALCDCLGLALAPARLELRQVLRALVGRQSTC